MSITTRLYFPKELEAIKSGKNEYYNNLITTFMNGKSFSQEEIRVYPYQLRKTFIVSFSDYSTVEVYAVDTASLFWFVEKEYKTDQIELIEEEIKTVKYIPVEIPWD